MEIDSAVPILVHLLQPDIDLLLTDIIPEPPQQKFERATADVPRIVAVVHLEDLLQLLYLLHLVGVEFLHVLQLAFRAHEVCLES
jgi:hypothetical protein